MTLPTKIVELLKGKNEDEAVKLLVKAVTNEPDEPLHYVNLGTILFQHKQYDEAKQFFERAIQLDQQMATAYYGLATICFELKEYVAAEQLLKTCITLKLEDADVYYLLGMTYVKQHNNLLALPFLQRATELMNEVSYLFQYGLALANTNHFVEAKSIFETILSLDPQHADTMYNLAIIYIHEDHLRKAVKILKEAIQYEPNHSLAINVLQQIENNS